MSPKIPRLTAKQIIRFMEKNGFVLTRQSGSHKIYKSLNGKRVTVPYHTGEILHPKLVKSILNDAGWTVEDFTRWLSS